MKLLRCGSQARRSLREYGLSKLKLSTKGNPYGLSITRALQSFYAGLGKTLDDRLSPELGRDVTSLCVTIGQEGVGEEVTSRVVQHLHPLTAGSGSASIAGNLDSGGDRLHRPGSWHVSYLQPDIEFVFWSAILGGFPKTFKARALRFA